MIISRTPYRISFFGGGTDFPHWYLENSGAVLSTTIDKYCYLTVRHLPPFFTHQTRIVYSKMEHINHLEEIDHPAVREVMRYLGKWKGLEIHHDGDLPARSGIGSSSAFTVGLLNSLGALVGKTFTKAELAQKSIFIEQELIKENVGSQDQTATSHGGLNHIQFLSSGEVKVHPVTLTARRQDQFQNHLLLFFLGTSRISSEVAAHFIKNISSKRPSLGLMHSLVEEALDCLLSARSLKDFGLLLHESWKLKKAINPEVSSSLIDQAYETGRRHGAWGGKLLGAGGGGFLLLFAPPEQHEAIKAALSSLLCVPFSFENQGSQIIFKDELTHPTEVFYESPSYEQQLH
jgi:D-glycero-alpha-D-manno-heptose-7-phosphate kinase